MSTEMQTTASASPLVRLWDENGIDRNDARRLLSRLARPGTDWADLYFQETTWRSWGFEEGILKGGGFSIDRGVGLRCVSGEKSALAYTSNFDLAALSACADRAAAIASSGRSAVVPSEFRPRVVPALSMPAPDTDTAEEQAYVEQVCAEQGVPCVLSEVFAKGGEGGKALAEKVLEILEDRPIQYTYPLEMPLKDKINAIATKIYRADGVNYSAAASKTLAELTDMGYGNLPVCIAKTQYSFSDNAKLIGAPTGFTMEVREVRLAAGAGFVVVICGNIMTMPGLPKKPAAVGIDVDANGKMYAVDSDGDEVRVNEDDLYNSWFYASKSDVEDSSEYRIKEMNYSAGSKADGETAELAFTLYGDKKGKLEGILRIYIGRSGSSKGDITYTVKPGEEVAFDDEDFVNAYDNAGGSGTMKYVVFEKPSSDYSNAGTVYSRYGKRNATSFTRSELDDYKFYYGDSDYGDYDLDELSFVADKSFSDSIEIAFTAYGGRGSKENDSVSGTLKITSSKSASSSKGDITYTVKAGEEVTFDDDDFEKIYENSSCTGSFKYVGFSRPDSAFNNAGTLYSRYGKRNETAFTRSSLSGTTYGYDSYEEAALEKNLNPFARKTDKPVAFWSGILDSDEKGGIEFYIKEPDKRN